MKKRILAMIPALIMLISLCSMGAWADTMNFSDVEEGSWYEDYVEYCYENGLMNGTSSTTFAPGVTTTRSMIIQTLYNLAGNPEVSGSSGFSDVVSGSWYEDALIWGEEKGIATGYGDGTFGPDDVVTREQMATFFYRYADICGYDVTDTADLSAYSDESEISDWAYDAVEWAVGVGLIQGTSSSTVSPGNDATRSELATILTRFNKNIVLAREGVTVVDSGTCGDDLIWVFYSDGLLEISGTGDMDDYVIADLLSGGVVEVLPPWYDYCDFITELIINEGVTRIGECAFMDCSGLESVTMPESLKSIGYWAFRGCSSLTSIAIPDSVTEIDFRVFYCCASLTSITVPGSVINMGSGVFDSCVNLIDVTLEDGLTSISYGMFYYCTSLTSITIPDSVTSIEDFAFAFCENLESITIPDSVTSIDYHAFYECTSLTDVYYSGTKEEWEAIDFDDEDDNECLANATIHFNSTGPEE